MDQFLSFIGAHPLLTGSFVAVLVLFILNETQRGGKTIGAQGLVDWVNQHNALVLDVRDRKAFASGHIAQSLNIPFATLEKSLSELEDHRGRPLVLVCQHGQQAGAAGTVLRKHKFEPVLRLEGGLAGWRAASLPLVKGRG
jgi:rhodanese-related sulfurtransferase